jgi:hypothetical protein
MMTSNDKYEIKPLETDKQNIPQRAVSKNDILCRYPFSLILSGRSGSGKTNLLLSILTRTDMFKDYFHKIIIVSPTASNLDDTYDVLKLPKENFIKTFTPELLETILKNRKEQIEKKGIDWTSRNDRIIIVFDDMIAEKIMNTKEMLMMFTLLRHYLIAIVINSQSYKKVPRGIRINSNMICVFPSLRSETDVMIEEICPPGITKNQFRDIISYCTKGRYDFMTINNHAKDPTQRIRKNLGEIIDLKNIDKYK